MACLADRNTQHQENLRDTNRTLRRWTNRGCCKQPVDKRPVYAACTQQCVSSAFGASGTRQIKDLACYQHLGKVNSVPGHHHSKGLSGIASCPPSPLPVRNFSARSGSVPGCDDGEGLKLEFPLAQSAFSPLLSAAWLKISSQVCSGSVSVWICLARESLHASPKQFLITSLSLTRALASRAFTVPSGTPSRSAVSRMLKPSKWRK
jgi:hypothetical protein